MLVSTDELIAKMEEIIADLPNVMNPRAPSGPGCAYQSEFPGEREHCRCFIGELAHRFGWKVPPATDLVHARLAARNYDWPISDRAAEGLLNLQSMFDVDASKGIPWLMTWQRAKYQQWM